MTNEDGRHEKKQYEAPKITMICLRPEEAVLGNCKSMTGGAGGPVSSTCMNAGMGCSPLGS
jgi:hypothetical protein